MPAFAPRKRVPFPATRPRRRQSHERAFPWCRSRCGVGGLRRGRLLRMGCFQFRDALGPAALDRAARPGAGPLPGRGQNRRAGHLRHLAVYPVLVDDVPLLRGRWLTADAAISRGVLVITEKPGGSVPLVQVENRSRDEYVFVMAGEVIAGGMQTRTVRHEVVLAPGQKIDLDVFCVEHARWSGDNKFAGGSKTMLPQSIKGKLRQGAGQSEMWSEVDRNNIALKPQNATGNLDEALQAAPGPGEARRGAAADRPGDSPGHDRFHFRRPRPPAGPGTLRQRAARPPAPAQAAGFLRRGLRDPRRRGPRPREPPRQSRGDRLVRAGLPRGQPAGQHAPAPAPASAPTATACWATA